MAWKQNIIEDFKQLVSFDSISFHERKTADWLIERLQKMGFSVEEDDAGSHYGGDTGNLYAVLDGTLPGDPVIFCAHMDVVELGSGKKSVLEKDGTIHSAGDTVLGADDISGILEILYGVQLVLDSGKPHKKIEILFTIGEELYVKGSDVFDYSKVTAKQAYVLDLSEETTFNIGTIQGGTATNIVPDCCVLTAYETPLESKSVTDFQKACEILGFSGELTGTFGGSDNNSFAKTESKGLFYRMECIMHIRHVNTQPSTIFIKEQS